MRGPEIRSGWSTSPLHLPKHGLDVGNGSVLENPVAQVEDVRTAGECVKDSRDRRAQLFTAGGQRKRLQIALWRGVGRQFFRGPQRIARFVQTEGVDASVACVGRGLSAG